MSFAVLSAVALMMPNHRPAVEPFVIINARIELSPGVVIPKGGIKVKDGKIEAVGAEIAATAGYETVDAKGGWVFPGFIESYTRDGLKLPETPKAPAPPEASRDALYGMFHANRRGIFPTLDASKIFDAKGVDTRYFAQGVTTVHAASGRGAFGGQSAVFNLTATATLLKAGASETVAIVTGAGDGYPASPMGNYAVVRQFLADARFAASNTSTDPDELALAASLNAKRPFLVAASTERQIDRALKLSEEFDLNVVLLGGRDAAVRANDLNAKRVGVLLDIAPGDSPTKVQSSDADEKLSDPPIGYLDERFERWSTGAKYASRIQAAGVPFAFYADSAKGKFLEHLRQHISMGLSREAALAAVTISAAKIMGLDAQLGTISPGKWANLTMFPGDFTVAGSSPTLVVVGGEKKEVKL